jgi:hypothetical protein
MSASFYFKTFPPIFLCFSTASRREVHERSLPLMNSDTTSGSSRRQIVCLETSLLPEAKASKTPPVRTHRATGAGLVPSVAGTYEDVLVRPTGGWRFRERRLVHDLAAELRLSLPSMRSSPARVLLTNLC